MLTGLLEPTSGNFFICGVDGIRHAEATKGLFGVVSQEVALYAELTAYENLAFIANLYRMPAQIAKQRIALLLTEAGLADRAHDLAGDFSTGMQRKLSIAIALVHQPRVIFMDEPTVGLDPGSRRHIWESLVELKKSGVTILLTTHYLEEAELLADRIGIIRQGRMVAEGTIEELRTQLRSVRTIEVELVQHMSSAQCHQQIGHFNGQESNWHLDELRNTLVFTLPADAAITDYLQHVISYLKAEKIEFEKFSTREPSLEEIYLSVQQSAESPLKPQAEK
jgi:ABC-2 type transport system ATP-binding protein